MKNSYEFMYAEILITPDIESSL